MAPTQSMTRRALLKGAAIAIVGANVAGTAALATEVQFPTPEMIRMAADGMIETYARYDVRFIPQPDGRVFRSIFIGEESTYNHEAVAGLDKRMDEWPELRRAVVDRVLEKCAA